MVVCNYRAMETIQCFPVKDKFPTIPRFISSGLYHEAAVYEPENAVCIVVSRLPLSCLWISEADICC